MTRFTLALLAVVVAAGTAHAKPWLAANGDLDGVKGDEQLTLDTDGTLVAGTVTLKIKMHGHEGTGTAFEDAAALQVVSLGGKRRGVLVGIAGADSEDPGHWYRVFLYDQGTLTQVLDHGVDAHGRSSFSFKNGVMSYMDWTECSASKTKQVRVRLKLNKAGTTMIESRKPTGKVMSCDGEVAACPFVYEVDGGGLALQGEILRNIRGAAAAATQTLALGSTSGPTTIVLSEEKLEVTFLDAIHVEVDGIVITARECIGNPTLPYCAQDGTHHLMHYGETLSLTFDAPDGARMLVAHGYYVPTP